MDISFLPDGEVLTVQEIQDFLKIGHSMANKWVKENLPFFRVGKLIRVLRKDFEDWIANNKTQSD